MANEEYFIIAAALVFVVVIVILLLKLQKSLLSINSQHEQLRFKEEYIYKIETELSKNNLLLDEERAEKSQLSVQLELYKEKNKELLERSQESDKARTEAMQNAKAALFDMGNQLSNKLIEEHNRQTQESKLATDNKIKETTRTLYEQFEKISNYVAALTSQVKESSDTVNLVKRALLSPVGAGNLAEICLENILKSSGLIEKRDFILQYSVAGNVDNARLRPDAVVFLPSNNVMVIDSKASKFFTELAKEHLGEEEQILNEKLKATMRTHLKDIIVKDYKEAVRKHLTKIRGTSNISNISTVMFLPSETALEKLQMIDKDFLYKAWENGVYPAGPVGIINILAHAKFQIIEEKQAENHLLINEEVRKLLSSISTLHDYMRKIGSSIHSAASNFDKMAASFNNNLLPKVRNLNRLGVDSKQNKTVPLYLDRYHIISATMVENEQKTPEEILELEDLENK